MPWPSAELAGLYGQRAALTGSGDHQGAQQLTQQLLESLERGRWPLTRGVAEFYLDELGGTAQGTSWYLAAALDDFWRGGAPSTPRGLRVSRSDAGSVLVLSRSSGTRTAMLASVAEEFFEFPEAGHATWRLTDPDGQFLSNLLENAIKYSAEGADPQCLAMASRLR